MRELPDFFAMASSIVLRLRMPKKPDMASVDCEAPRTGTKRDVPNLEKKIEAAHALLIILWPDPPPTHRSDSPSMLTITTSDQIAAFPEITDTPERKKKQKLPGRLVRKRDTRRVTPNGIIR